MIVVDASAVVDLLLRTPAGLDVESRRLHLRGRMDADRGRQALTDLRDLNVTRHPHAVLLDRAWQLRDNLTFYDAMYVALAEALRATVVTLDARIRDASGHSAKVDVKAASA